MALLSAERSGFLEVHLMTIIVGRGSVISVCVEGGFGKIIAYARTGGRTFWMVTWTGEQSGRIINTRAKVDHDHVASDH